MRHRLRRHASLIGLFAFLSLAPVAAGQLASRPAEDWIKSLDRPERIATLKIPEILERIKLKPGDVVADIGAGAGVFSLPLAKAVGPKGKVYAVDIEQGLMDYIDAKAKAQNVTNVVTVLGKFTDANLPAKDVDVVFIHDVLHHIEDRATYLRNLGPYLKPASRVVIIDPDPAKGGHRNDPTMQVSKEQAGAWLAGLGFKPVEEFPLFDTSWFVSFARP